MDKAEIQAAIELANERIDFDALKRVMIYGNIRYTVDGFQVITSDGIVQVVRDNGSKWRIL